MQAHKNQPSSEIPIHEDEQEASLQQLTDSAAAEGKATISRWVDEWHLDAEDLGMWWYANDFNRTWRRKPENGTWDYVRRRRWVRTMVSS